MIVGSCPGCGRGVTVAHARVVRHLFTGEELWHLECFQKLANHAVGRAIEARAAAIPGDDVEITVGAVRPAQRREARAELFRLVGTLLGVALAAAVILALGWCHKT